jgi:hypothetical protein
MALNGESTRNVGRLAAILPSMHAWDKKSSFMDRTDEVRSMLRRPWTWNEPGVRQ